MKTSFELAYSSDSAAGNTANVFRRPGVYYNFYQNGDHEMIEGEKAHAQNLPEMEDTDFFVICYPDPAQDIPWVLDHINIDSEVQTEKNVDISSELYVNQHFLGCDNFIITYQECF